MAELALAIVPLCIEAVRLGKAMRSRLATFRTYMQTVEEHRTNFDVQVLLFVSECNRILKQAVRDCPGVNLAQCIDQANRSQLGRIDFSSPELDLSLQSMFGSSIKTVTDLIKLIIDKVSTIEDELGRYGEVGDNGREVFLNPSYRDNV